MKMIHFPHVYCMSFPSHPPSFLQPNNICSCTFAYFALIQYFEVNGSKNFLNWICPELLRKCNFVFALPFCHMFQGFVTHLHILILSWSLVTRMEPEGFLFCIYFYITVLDSVEGSFCYFLSGIYVFTQTVNIIRID
jgi:hypothetical protein